jgi:hypothetical protein
MQLALTTLAHLFANANLVSAETAPIAMTSTNVLTPLATRMPPVTTTWDHSPANANKASQETVPIVKMSTNAMQ